MGSRSLSEIVEEALQSYNDDRSTYQDPLGKWTLVSLRNRLVDHLREALSQVRDDRIKELEQEIQELRIDNEWQNQLGEDAAKYEEELDLAYQVIKVLLLRLEGEGMSATVLPQDVQDVRKKFLHIQEADEDPQKKYLTVMKEPVDRR